MKKNFCGFFALFVLIGFLGLTEPALAIGELGESCSPPGQPCKPPLICLNFTGDWYNRCTGAPYTGGGAGSGCYNNSQCTGSNVCCGGVQNPDCTVGTCYTPGGGGGGGLPPIVPPPVGYAASCTGRDNIYPVPSGDQKHSDPNEAGIVPCGITKYTATDATDTNRKGTIKCPCQLGHLFIMMLRIYTFILWFIATPLAGLLIVIGGLLMILSGGPGSRNPVTGIVSPNLYSTAKNMMMGAAIGVVLIFASYLIVDIILRVLGFGGLGPIPI